MRLAGFTAAAAIAAFPLMAQIPEDGRILALRQDEGIQLIQFFGPNSVKGFFAGQDFTWVKSDEQNPDPSFWIDGVLVQWGRFTRRDIQCKQTLKGQDLVEFFFHYETDYLKRVSGVDPSQLHIERFSFTAGRQSDGAKHRFLIWSATPHGGNAKQYWIVTEHPQGLMVMSLIPRSSVHEDKIRLLIDSYMAGYGVLTQKEVEASVASLKAFELQGGQDQVPSITRKPSDKPGVESIAFPPTTDSNQP